MDLGSRPPTAMQDAAHSLFICLPHNTFRNVNRDGHSHLGHVAPTAAVARPEQDSIEAPHSSGRLVRWVGWRGVNGRQKENKVDRDIP